MSEYIEVGSKATGNIHRIYSIKNYRIERSLDIPADSFDFVIGNYDAEVTSRISAGDEVAFYIDGKVALRGYIDDITAEYSISGNDARIVGRDQMSILLDNDAQPSTYYDLGLKDYMDKILPQYGITNYTCSDNTKFKKIAVSPGETEYGVIERLAEQRGLYPFYDGGGTFRVEKLRSDWVRDYYFTNDAPAGNIKIKEATITASADVRNHIIVHGEKKEKTQIQGDYKDLGMPVKKRKFASDGEIETTENAKIKAKNVFYETNKNALNVNIKTKTIMPIEINKVALVQINRLKFYNYLLVDNVVYSKDLSSGSETEITCKLIQTVASSWGYNTIPTLPLITPLPIKEDDEK